jgi:hypothetical protein
MQLDQLKRREFIPLLGGAAACYVCARSRRPLPVMGFVIPQCGPFWFRG